MTERGMESHKRSKSGLPSSMLHHDKSKDEENMGDGTENRSLVDENPTMTDGSSHHHHSSHSRSSRHKKGASDNWAQEGDGSVPPSQGNAAVNPSVLKAQDVPTIQESVRMFKLFEILRSGNSAAIAKAVKDTSELPPTMKRGDEPTAAPKATSGRLEGTTILHLAIQCADPAVVEQIISVAKSTPGAAIDVNARDREGNTPLHLASMLGRPTTVRLLLDQPETIDSLLDYQGRSPLDVARTPDIFQQLQLSRSLFIDTKIKEMQILVSKRSYDEIEKMFEDSHVENVLDVNSEELSRESSTVQTGGTLLHEAARNKDLKLIQILLLHGADPFRRDHKGKLPQDVTKDEKTRSILKKSPAAAAAQRGVQEKAILGNPLQPADSSLGGKEGREIKGYLKKWTNYTTGYKLRWFVLEDGVLSYYKHQDDAGSACRGAINMRIAKLDMDLEDKTKFEIQGKSSVKYHLKANHVVEAQSWFWALTNAIQWTKDEAKEEEKQRQRKAENLRQAKEGKSHSMVGAQKSESKDESKFGTKSLHTATAIGVPLTSASSRVSFQGSTYDPGSTIGDDEDSSFASYNLGTTANEPVKPPNDANTAAITADADEDEEYGDDVSSHEIKPAGRDAFNISAHSATLQLNLLGQVSVALQAESSKHPEMRISDPNVAQAISTYESAVCSLQGLVGDLLKISRDREAYWQCRLDREADVRHLWEDSMARIAKEQEQLEGRIGEAEDKRKRTKRALREVLEETSAPQSLSQSRATMRSDVVVADSPELQSQGRSPGIRQRERRRSTIADLMNLSDSDEDEDEEFFDAIGTGEVEVAEMPVIVPSPAKPSVEQGHRSSEDICEVKRADIMPSFKGYEDPVRTRLKMEADDRPKVSLWGILKSMIGKDMTKMTLPVSFNEPTSLLQRVTEDMEYTDLLDTAADRADSTERMVYVAAFAASEYASTIGRVAKPFNPLLGETFEYVRPDKGYRFFIEQVSHHPPIGAAWAESAKWDYYGESAVKSKFYGKSFDINPLGTWFLKLRPSGGEELYTWKKVTSSVIGIITGNPTVDNYGPMLIKNHTTGETCTLDFKPRGWKASSAYIVNGKIATADGKTRWSIGGRWNDKIYARLTPGFEDSVLSPTSTTSKSLTDPTQAFLVWQAHPRPQGIPFNLTPFVVTFQSLPDRLRPFLPPTDTRFRPDQVAMEDGKYELAATEKNRVEEQQRARRRERGARGEEFVPRWFAKRVCKVTGEEYWWSGGAYWGVREKVGRGEGVWDGVKEIF